MRSLTHAAADELERAIDDEKTAIQLKGDEFWPYLGLACANARLGRQVEASEAVLEAQKLNPELSVTYVQSLTSTYHEPHLEKFLSGLRQAGLPEE
jgi:hypothetical protein